MNPAFIDPNNHVPDVSADDGWDNAEGYSPENSARAATVLPPRRSVADRPPETSPVAEIGLRIDSTVPRTESEEPTTRLEVQEINGGIIRLEQEVPAPPKVARQVTFHERPVKEKGDSRQHGEGKDWGVSLLQGHRWLIGGGLAVAVIVIGGMILLPVINAPNRTRGQEALAPVLTEEKDERLEQINRLLGRQQEAIQLFSSYAHAVHPDEIVPLIRDGSALRETILKHWKPLHISRQWAPSIESQWAVLDSDGLPRGLLTGALPDGQPFAAYVAQVEGKLLLDWKATTAFGTATFSELGSGTGDSSEIRGEMSPATYYSPSYPEEEYRSYRLVSPDGSVIVWCYVRRGTHVEAAVASHFQAGEILRETPSPRKITVKLERGPEGALPNQWVVAEMLHIDWATP